MSSGHAMPRKSEKKGHERRGLGGIEPATKNEGEQSEDRSYAFETEEEEKKMNTSCGEADLIDEVQSRADISECEEGLIKRANQEELPGGNRIGVPGSGVVKGTQAMSGAAQGVYRSKFGGERIGAGGDQLANTR